MEQYKGSVTTVGNSEAIQLEKGLFKQHPEFSRKARVTASVFAPGKILISLENDPIYINEEDPILSSFLAFLEKDMADHPEHITPFTEEEYNRTSKLTAGVNVSDNEIIPDDVTL